MQSFTKVGMTSKYGNECIVYKCNRCGVERTAINRRGALATVKAQHDCER